MSNRTVRQLMTAALFCSLIVACAAPPRAAAPQAPAAEAPAAQAPAATSAPAAAESGGQKAYKAVLINNFMGNTWRPIMERSAQLLIDQPPLQGRISSLRIINTENSATAQNAALNSLVQDQDKPDLIVMIAASPTASNQAIRAACDAGITVVSFDVLVEEPCAWTINQDWKAAGRGWARWMMQQIAGKGVIFQDLGQAGASSSRDIVAGNNEVLKDYPDVKIYTYYGEFAQGTEQAQVATLLAAHPEVNGLLTHGYGANALYALEKAGMKPLPTTGFAYNESLLACIKYSAPCALKAQGAWVSGEALKLGVDVLDGKITGEPRFIAMQQPWFTDDPNFKPEEGEIVLPLKTSALADKPGGLILPLSPPWATLDIEEVLKPPVLQ